MIWENAASVYYRPDRAGFWEMPAARRQALIQALTEVHKLGCSVTSFVNWRLLAEYNQTWNDLKPLVQESLFGIGLFGFPCGTMDGGWYNDPGYEMGSHAVCCGADGFLRYGREVLERTLDLGFDVISVDQASEWNYCLSRHHGHASPWEAWARTYAWFDEVTRTTRSRQAGAYTIAELPDLYNTQSIDVWWNWMWRDAAWANLAVYRYIMPTMIPAWCIDENQRDVIAEAFALGSFLAIATHDMTGLLSDVPELAAQVRRLAHLRKATAAFVSHGQFLDNRGLTVKGGKGYVYISSRGLAVTLANGLPKRKWLQVTLDAGQFAGWDISQSQCKLFVEGAAPRLIIPQRSEDILTMRVMLPAYAAGVLTLERNPGS
jgi:hypothetical protein